MEKMTRTSISVLTDALQQGAMFYILDVCEPFLDSPVTLVCDVNVWSVGVKGHELISSC